MRAKSEQFPQAVPVNGGNLTGFERRQDGDIYADVVFNGAGNRYAAMTPAVGRLRRAFGIQYIQVSRRINGNPPIDPDLKGGVYVWRPLRNPSFRLAAGVNKVIKQWQKLPHEEQADGVTVSGFRRDRNNGRWAMGRRMLNAEFTRGGGENYWAHMHRSYGFWGYLGRKVVETNYPTETPFGDTINARRRVWSPTNKTDKLANVIAEITARTPY